MQQTDKYQLNLIERDDVFSPDALNESTQKVESVLYNYMSGETSARVNADAALDLRASGLESRVTALEVHKVVVGSYVGNNKSKSFDLGFTPLIVLLSSAGYSSTAIITADHPLISSYRENEAEIIENGFAVLLPPSSPTPQYNYMNKPYIYIAFA